MLAAARHSAYSENRVGSYYRARYYDPQSGRFVSEDPIRFAGSTSFYLYVLNRPTIGTDPNGLKILICSRTGFQDENGKGKFGDNVNHAFFYDTRNGDNCARGEGNHPNGKENIKATGTFCREVPGSDGHENNVMKCCRDTAASFWGGSKSTFIFGDCQALLGRCLKKEGLANPGVPGGRLGCRGNCPTPADPPLLDPYQMQM
jgi:RHS repeat-associated protein